MCTHLHAIMCVCVCVLLWVITSRMIEWRFWTWELGTFLLVKLTKGPASLPVKFFSALLFYEVLSRCVVLMDLNFAHQVQPASTHLHVYDFVSKQMGFEVCRFWPLSSSKGVKLFSVSGSIELWNLGLFCVLGIAQQDITFKPCCAPTHVACDGSKNCSAHSKGNINNWLLA